MSARSRVAILAVSLGLTAALAAGCGSSSSKGAATTTTLGGDRDAFCRDNTLLNTATNAAKSITDVVKIFQANVGIIDDFGDQAPAAIRADAHSIVIAAHKVISTSDAKSFGTAAVAAAGQKVDTYCADTASPTTT